ncbi:mitochondrial thiamine pyrophosphate carrier [Anabrus simplex]|uniref:mitochondrial thiamine pyrophosphate carrier n=1 Tax=Anabrus simplex TaxID=316456 RepID=UPI0035A302F1
MVKSDLTAMAGLDLSEEEHEKKRKKPNATDHAIAGGVSGCVTRFFCQPLDVIKIRFQLQVEPLSRRSAISKYRSIIQANRRIIREEGIAALWKGHIPAQLLSITYGIVQFAAFESLTNQMQNISSDAKNYQSSIYFVSGAAAGCLATLFSFPFDVVRTRLVAQGEPKYYKGVVHAFYKIYTKEGLRAFFKGLTPALLQVAPHAGVQFAAYKMFKNILIQNESEDVQAHEVNECSLEALSFSGTLLCGSLAGACAKTVVYPLDVARKRLQIQGFEKARIPFGQLS